VNESLPVKVCTALVTRLVTFQAMVGGVESEAGLYTFGQAQFSASTSGAETIDARMKRRAEFTAYPRVRVI
jgi:hypothetical protein